MIQEGHMRMFHVKHHLPLIRKAKAITIIQIEKPMFHVKHWLCLIQNQDSLKQRFEITQLRITFVQDTEYQVMIKRL